MPDELNRTKITVQVQPGARRNEVVGFSGEVLKVKIAAPPVEGKANKKLVEFLGECLGIGKSHISILKGETGRNKIVAIEGLAKGEVLQRLASI